MAQTMKSLPTVQETRAPPLSWEDPLEKENGHPLQYPCLENSTDRSLVGSSPRVAKESDTTDRLTPSFSFLESRVIGDRLNTPR